MMDTIPMACMQQQFFTAATPQTIGQQRPGCRQGIISNPHSAAAAMKSLSPNYENDPLELDEYSSSFYSEFLDDDRYPKVNYGGIDNVNGVVGSMTTTTTTTINSYGSSYDTTASHEPCYNNNNNNNNNNDQVTPTPPMGCNVTAFNKSLNTLTNLDENWQGEHPNAWNHAHVTQWLLRVCERHQLDYERLRSGYGDYEWDSLTGCSLVALFSNSSRHDMINRFPYGGTYIYDALQEVLLTPGHIDNENSLYSYDTSYNWTDVNGYNVNNVIGVNRHNVMNGHNTLELNQNYGSIYPVKHEIDSDMDSNQSRSTYTTTPYPNCRTETTCLPICDETKLLRRKPGRPPNKEKKTKSKNGQRGSRLWEFIRDLLLDSKTCPSLLKWEDIDEGIFRFVQSDRVAKLWGERKCNPRMTYEKLSRAMRYYYKSQVFLPVIGKRLVYRFGPNATGWRPNAHIIAMCRA